MYGSTAKRLRGVLAGLVAAAALSPVLAVGGAAPDTERRAFELLGRRCAKCHGARARMAGLDLRSPAALLRGGIHGPAVAPGAPTRSLLVRRVEDRTMPPAGEPRLTAPETALLRRWIGSMPPPASAAAAPVPGKVDYARARSHWAFRPPTPPRLPTVRQRSWVRNPIDAYVLARLEAAGIPPPAAAPDTTLVRRVTLDVTGLPPAPEDVEAFARESAAVGRERAYRRLVDRLLASPAYGERWGRKWLDVARYAESNGYERDGGKPHAWRYRDYVIDALNRDKPFDRFLTEQLAGDEMEDTGVGAQIATTFLRLGTWDDEPAEAALDRYEQLDDVLGTASAAFMGVTLRCARCHDHKFEPFSQKEYYRFLAIFEPLKRPQNGRTDLDRLVGTEAELSAYREATARADAAAEVVQRPLEALTRAVQDRLFSSGRTTLPPDAVAAFRTEPEKRTETQKALVRRWAERWTQETRPLETAAEKSRREELEAGIARIDAARPPEPPRAYVWFEDSPRPSPTRLLLRGDPAHPGEEVSPGLPALLCTQPVPPPTPRTRSSGRRLWLARWLTRPDHPLTARVIANRVWQGHFGEGLVASENDFGLMGQLPTHPELLDYLAWRLARGEPAAAASPWSLKALHRLILTSATYRAEARWSPALARRDGDGTLFWRWKPRRLEAEAVRDSILAVTGRLNPERGGPSIYPTIPRAVLEGQSRPGDGWGKSDERQASRRSVYIFAKRNLALPELEVLDAPDTTSSCEQRPTSIIAPQALTFLNGEFMQAQARHFADRLEREAGSAAGSRVRRAFALACGRSPSASEVRASLEFLAAQQRQVELDPATGSPVSAPRRALEAFCLMLLNSNELFYLH